MRVWKLGADIDTDQLAPGATMKHGLDVTARHCLETVRPGFASLVKPGDVIVAGPNFGIGSSREQAATVLVKLGVAAVIAPSFAGLYFRNACNVGLLLLTCAEADRIADGAALTFDARAACIDLVGAPGGRLACDPIPGFLLDMIDAGGLLPLLTSRANAPMKFHDTSLPERRA